MSETERFTFDRRRHARTRVQMMLKGIRLDPDGGEVIDTLHMQDISKSGLGAVAQRGFYPGQRMVLCLPLSGQGGRRNVYARIVRCNPEGVAYRVGLEFDVASVGAWCGVSTDATAAA
jgi:hypothetical protein